MFLKPKFEPDQAPAESQESLPKLRLEELPKVMPHIETMTERKSEVTPNTTELSYLRAIERNTASIRGWITFIGVLIVIGIVMQLLSSCASTLL